jgi:hypothetical protein
MVSCALSYYKKHIIILPSDFHCCYTNCKLVGTPRDRALRRTSKSSGVKDWTPAPPHNRIRAVLLHMDKKKQLRHMPY